MPKDRIVVVHGVVRLGDCPELCIGGEGNLGQRHGLLMSNAKGGLEWYNRGWPEKSSPHVSLSPTAI